MASGADPTEPTATEMSDLSALADGTLDPARRAQVEARIAASPELTARYERERRLVAALHHARATDRAPARLRARIEAARPGRAKAARRRLTYSGAVAGALAATALGLVLALPSGTPGAPSVSDAAALAARGPNQAAPAPDPHDPAARLLQRVNAVYFPNWATRLDWQAIGARTDHLRGHTAVTVYYAYQGDRMAYKGEQIAYTIVSPPALAQPAAREIDWKGTKLRALNMSGRRVVTWRESGDTCVLSGTGLTAAALEKLAAWKAPAAGH